MIPFYMRHVTAPLAIGDLDQLAVGPWHEMMHYRTSFPTDLDEICGIFPVKDQPARAPKGQEIIKAFTKAITLLGEHAKRGEYPVTYGMYFRYLQGTNGGLSFTSHPEDHHVCAMDLTTNYNVRGFDTFKKAMQNFFIDEMHAKFHWGKNAPQDIDYAKLYGAEWDKVKQTLETWHHHHHISTVRSALLNPLFSSVLGYPVPSLVDTDVVIAQPTAAKKYTTALNAKKMVEMVSDNSVECQKLKAQIEADINKAALHTSSIFTNKPTEPTPPVVAPKKSGCVIL
jgi:hypothetical protein